MDITEAWNAHIENSIRKKFHGDIFSRFTKAIVRYKLVEPGDRIAVCVSGGKDSFLMAKLFMELMRHHRFPFELRFLNMDPGYSEENRQSIKDNAYLMRIPLETFETQVFEAAFRSEKSPCYLCARMRRGYLYKEARDRGCNKIALAHHYDDVIETLLMGMLYSGQISSMMPKLKSTNFEGMQLIRPLYLVREEDIKRWRDYNSLHFLNCACRFTEACNRDEEARTGSKRLETKRIISELKKDNPYVETNIFNSMHNVSLNTLIGYTDTEGNKHDFLDRFEEPCDG
ncbi:MAG: ATPase [Lachnospiraceae bacterium]|nr:ATPase [Lachnospiraceae bacterium]